MKAKILLQKIRDHFPQITWKKHRVLNHGFDHTVIILDEKIVFRFPKSQEYQKSLANEVLLLKYLKKKLKVGVPEYSYIPEDKSFGGYKILNGQELSRERFWHLSNLEKDAVAKQLAEFLSTLHTTPKSISAKYNVQTEDPTENYARFTSDVKKLVFPKLSKKEVEVVEEYFNELKDTLKHNYSNVLLHHDLTWVHILWDGQNQRVNIIDFSDRELGDPARDFAGLWEYGEQFVTKVYALYKGKKDSNLLYRSELYFKRVPLSDMKNALQGRPRSFAEGYDLFRKRFGV